MCEGGPWAAAGDTGDGDKSSTDKSSLEQKRGVAASEAARAFGVTLPSCGTNAQ